MRGLRLFVRPFEAPDNDSVRAFLEKSGESPAISGPERVALVGKLLGDLVAYLALYDTGDALRIDEIVVARELRRKRIGRVMIGEAAALAGERGRKQLEVSDPRGAEAFLERVGFRDLGDRWALPVSRASRA